MKCLVTDPAGREVMAATSQCRRVSEMSTTTRYVECCGRMVPAWAAMPYLYADKQPVYLCKVGEGCMQEGE